MFTLYGIRNCDTVKKARRWLEENGVEYRFHDFRKDALDKPLVAQWLAEVGSPVLLNKRGTTWRKLTPEQQQRAESDELAALLTEQPALIKRPVLLSADKPIMVGFKPEHYAEQLGL